MQQEAESYSVDQFRLGRRRNGLRLVLAWRCEETELVGPKNQVK
jgi:hypothetical protein